MFRGSRAVALVAALALGAAACGDDGDTATTTTTVGPTTTAADVGTTTADPSTAGPATTEPETTPGRASWTVEHLRGLQLGEANVAPVIEGSVRDQRILDEHVMWDWWPVRDRDGEVAEVDGWYVAIGLSAPDDVLPGKRHDLARLRYVVSEDGVRWQEGGEVFPEGDPLGSRQWAGSTMYDETTGEVFVFYTAAGDDDEEIEVERQPAAAGGGDSDTTSAAGGSSTTAETGGSESTAATGSADTTAASGGSGGDYAGGADISYEQRMVLARGTLEGDAEGVTFSGWGEHVVILEGEGELYAQTAQTTGGAGQIDAFRDPWYFRDPATQEEYILFTATAPDASCEADGVVGIARATSEDLDEWEALPPILDAICVNKELERPHLVLQDDRYYLLFTTHAHTFAEGLEGPEGLYGFVADELRGAYEPLNDSGLVLANPEEEPFQAYSWMTLPNGMVTSFFQYFDLPEGTDSLDYIGDASAETQFEKFGGTFAPSVEIELDGRESRVVTEHEPGQIVLSS
jgi:levansucrase